MPLKLTASDLATLNIITKVTGSIGLLGVFLFWTIFLRTSKSLESPTGRLLFTLSIVDFIDSLAKFIGRWGPDAGITSFLCQTQAAMIQGNNLMSVLIELTMALNALYIVYFRGSTDTIRKYEYWIIAFCILVPLPVAIVPIFYAPGAVRFYGDVNQWCWISGTYASYQVYMWFDILWIIFGFNLIAIILTQLALRKSSRIFLGTGQTPQSIRARMFVVERMTVYLIAFLIAWTPSTINRVYSLATGDQIFALAVMQCIVSPMRAMIDFLAFFYTWWRQPDTSNLRKGSSSSISGSAANLIRSTSTSKVGSAGKLTEKERRPSKDVSGSEDTLNLSFADVRARRGSADVATRAPGAGRHSRRPSQDPVTGTLPRPAKQRQASLQPDVAEAMEDIPIPKTPAEPLTAEPEKVED